VETHEDKEEGDGGQEILTYIISPFKYIFRVFFKFLAYIWDLFNYYIFGAFLKKT